MKPLVPKIISVSGIYLCPETVDHQWSWLLTDFHQHSNDNLLVNIIIPKSWVINLGEIRFLLPPSKDWHILHHLQPVLVLIPHVKQKTGPPFQVGTLEALHITSSLHDSVCPLCSSLFVAPCTDSFNRETRLQPFPGKPILLHWLGLCKVQRPRPFPPVAYSYYCFCCL